MLARSVSGTGIPYQHKLFSWYRICGHCYLKAASLSYLTLLGAGISTSTQTKVHELEQYIIKFMYSKVTASFSWQIEDYSENRKQNSCNV